MTEYVLWLPSWYPSETDSFNGDFIERHAKAVSAFVPVIVLYVTKDLSMKPGTTRIEKEMSGTLTVYRGYYGSSPFSWAEKAYSTFQYHSLQQRIFSKVKREHGMPALVHVHVAWKAGLFARVLQRRYGLQYLISEHWTGYYPESPNSVYKSGFLQRWATKHILRNAATLLPVADTLGKTIQAFAPVSYSVVPNVVDTNLFTYRPHTTARWRFLHVSAMGYVKNVEGIIRTAIQLHADGIDFELKLIGAHRQDLIAVARDANLLEKVIFFEPSLPYAQIATEMQHSSAFVLFSRFENMPCVILESLSSGLPVLSTNVGGIAEVISPENGILIQSEDETALKEAMKKMVQTNGLFDRSRIAENTGDKYSFSTVGKQMIQQYEQILKKEIKYAKTR